MTWKFQLFIFFFLWLVINLVFWGVLYIAKWVYNYDKNWESHFFFLYICVFVCAFQLLYSFIIIIIYQYLQECVFKIFILVLIVMIGLIGHMNLGISLMVTVFSDCGHIQYIVNKHYFCVVQCFFFVNFFICCQL